MQARAQFAAASAIRILGEREAAFATSHLTKTALDFGLKDVTAELVEARLADLTARGRLLPEQSRRLDGAIDLVTTPDALATEHRILDLVATEQGRGGRPIVAPATATERAAGASAQSLNAGQLAAAAKILGSSDRTVLVQGVAGAGKSTMLASVARVAETQGMRVLGLAFQKRIYASAPTSCARSHARKRRPYNGGAAAARRQRPRGARSRLQSRRPLAGAVAGGS